MTDSQRTSLGEQPVLLISGLAGALLDAVGLLVLHVLDLDDATHLAAAVVVNAAVALGVALVARSGVDSPATVERKVLEAIDLGRQAGRDEALAALGPVELPLAPVDEID